MSKSCLASLFTPSCLIIAATELRVLHHVLVACSWVRIDVLSVSSFIDILEVWGKYLKPEWGPFTGSLRALTLARHWDLMQKAILQHAESYTALLTKQNVMLGS